MQKTKARRTLICPSPQNGWLLAGLLLFSLLVAVAGSASAQSGRKLPNQKSQPPSPPPRQEPTEKKAEENKNSHKTPVLISYYSSSMNIPQYYTNLILSACADRLQGSGDVEVTVGREMNRKEAADFAKNSSDAYVLSLQLENDSMSSGSSDWNNGYPDPRNLLVNYTLYEPKTGKSRTSGRTYPRASATDPLTLPQGRMSGEYRLRRAAEEAADRILKLFGLASPTPRN